MGSYWIYIYFVVVSFITYGILWRWQGRGSTRVFAVVTICLFIYLGALVGLANVWYGNESTSSPHWFNDMGEWRFMDKLGHVFTAFTIVRFMSKVLKWAKCKPNVSIWLGAFLGFAFMCSIELLDSLSPKYGASVADIIANALGTLVLVVQVKLFGKVKLMPKFGFQFSQYAVLRPSMLGGTWAEQALKDYNGQTYWYSMGLRDITKIKFIPSWLQISVGIGADGLLGGFENQWEQNGQSLQMLDVGRFSEIYFSLDIDWELLFVNYKWIRRFMFLANNFKTPLPTLKFSTNGSISFYWFYF
ncbi:MAG: DUF2279 domain-containing protein [Bacteroidota bacterium]|nr:DUF2279 domain-containing protein [Bacteroidota bacterium]